MFNESFTVISTYRNGKEIEQRTAVISAQSPLEARQEAHRHLQNQYKVAYANNQLVLIAETVLVGAHEPCDLNNGEAFDFEGQPDPIDDEEKGMVLALRNEEFNIALVNCFFDRLATYAIAHVEQDEDQTYRVNPLFIRLTDEMATHLRAVNGEPLEPEKPVTETDPNLH